jgi:hypothetical protein
MPGKNRKSFLNIVGLKGNPFYASIIAKSDPQMVLCIKSETQGRQLMSPPDILNP